jgi:polyhydroxybutyrate depolymerase
MSLPSTGDIEGAGVDSDPPTVRHQKPRFSSSSYWFACTPFVALLLATIASCSSDSDPSAATTPPTGDDAGSTTDGASSTEDGPTGGDSSTNGSSLITARPYGKTIPTKYDAKTPTPLVMLLHGYTASGKVQDDYFKMSAAAEKKGFLLALPDGTKDPQGNRFWNATDACCNFYGAAVDDVAYLTAVLADMKASYNVDPKRVYLVGHSNGGFMSHRLACELSKDIAAIVSLAGATYTDASKCKATDPVSVLQVHGDADGTVSYLGGSFAGGVISYPGAKATVASWATKNGCGADLAGTAKLDLDTAVPGEETTVQSHTCTKGAAELWTIVGGAHVPPFQANWAELVYGFLEAHPKP